MTTIRIYNNGQNLWVEVDGERLRYQLIRLHINVRTEPTSEILLLVDSEGCQRSYTAMQVEHISITTIDGYSVQGKGMRPILYYKENQMGRVQEFSFECAADTWPLCTMEFDVQDRVGTALTAGTIAGTPSLRGV